ncbi:MAG: nicotinate-nucleotide diphosphorylase (carboxylating) [Planctomycetes bacterium GWF2_50_10]|nr:MAG: nicotinate-nucleotide diphosphorylase (carboxylating) [Planctomycetes bacterium GWF2_50_10]
MIKLPVTKEIKSLINLAVAEDLGTGDVTSSLTVPTGLKGTARLVTREDITVCGMELVEAILKTYDSRLKLATSIPDGGRAKKGQLLGTITGPMRPLLSAERVVLNFLQHLSGISTATARYAKQAKGTRAFVYDTRKTTPGFRTIEKYAVLCGGGKNHRTGLYDAILIKDNHLATFGPRLAAKLAELVEKAQKIKGLRFFEVEVDSLSQLEEVLKVKGVDIVLLDNFTPAQMKKAVKMRNSIKGKKPQLEASGGITLKNIKAVAQTGVERISVGAITHSAPAVDIGLDI